MRRRSVVKRARPRADARRDRFLPVLAIVSVVAIVAIVTLFLWSGKLSGAPIYSYVDEEQATCLDDDPKNDFYTPGTLKLGKMVYEDYCLNERLLNQHYCSASNQARLLAPYECPDGCSRGICIAK
ncbi:hypothetical protein GOV03_02035 [Candidatus Woesearchaeota archaeon]|nr:hypothetical protein [Candidatus Woesearchaeota archaeon]